MAIKIFVRQPLTQSGAHEARIVQAALDGIGEHAGERRIALEFLTGTKAHDASTFRDAFASEAGGAFAPRRFRDARLTLLSQADVMLVVRTGLSESGAFEVAYNIYGGRRIPMLFMVWDRAEIKTTLLRELDDLAAVRYVRFSDPAEVATAFSAFVDEVVLPDMRARGRTLGDAAVDAPRASTTFRDARRAARELGFPVSVRSWTTPLAQSVVVTDLASLVHHVESNHIAISREQPLVVERVGASSSRRRMRVETGTLEPTEFEAAAVEARSA